MIEELKQKIFLGKNITRQEIEKLAIEPERETLYRAASEITRHFGRPAFNPCSIINARAGQCSENCKWCAQSQHYHTSSDIYDIVSADRVLAQALHDEAHGVKRFCQVTSGRAVHGEALKKICDNYQTLHRETNLFLCGSLGLLNREELQQLWNAGMRRYHCNLETAPSLFPALCTTHTIEEKLQTLRWARQIGFELCSGGIIGLGETREQRIELAFKLQEIHPESIPLNILAPIKGTPLEDMQPISDDEILLTIALFRFIHPRAELRFAGGRARLSRKTRLRAMQIGINSAVVGDLLTTVGTRIEEDRQLALDAGYREETKTRKTMPIDNNRKE